MKKIITLIVLVVLGFFIWKEWYRPQQVVTDTGEVRDLCYSWNTEAGDKATLRMAIANGTQVTGRFDFVPAEKDSKRGTIEGVAGPLDQASMSRTADLVWNASAEGMTNREQLIVKFGDGTAAAGFGAMKEENGIYLYEDPSTLSFMPTMSQVDCGDTAL